jgi:hypothetical protein
MNLTKLISKKNNSKKLTEIVELVKTARKKYNNREAEINSPTVCTVNGGTNMKYLSNSDKAAVATQELQKILREINAIDETVQGVNVNRELTSLLATNPVLTNLEDSLTLGLE